MRTALASFVLLAAFLALCSSAVCSEETLFAGSKKFTESVILGEMLTQLGRSAGESVEHRAELGGTQFLFKGLVGGDLDFYAEYTGTIFKEILSSQAGTDLEHARRILREQGVEISAPLGFNNTYALGMRQSEAERLQIRTYSDLLRHPELRFGFTNEFMERSDGWPGLRAHYQLPQQDVTGLDHDIAYRALANGDLDIIDLYATDAEIEYYNLQVLTDDRRYFPRYDAVILYRADLERRAPRVLQSILKLTGSIAATKMVELNAQAKIAQRAESDVAFEFLQSRFGNIETVEQESLAARIGRRTVEHLLLVLVSLTLAVFTALPLGILASRHPALGQSILALTGIIQTIPSLALLALVIPLLGIGNLPAVFALFLYSLLPIVRNTFTGLRDISPSLRESAIALGIPRGVRLRWIELPLAAPSVLAGIKTAAVINVGTATLGVIIGAGGYGQPIMTGIRRDDLGTILEGAIPAALLALAVQAAFELLERWLLPPALRESKTA